MNIVRLNVTPEDDPVKVAEWVAQFERHRAMNPSPEADAAAEAEATEGSSPMDSELEEELERFRHNWPAYSERFSRVHKGLVDLGYVPVLPRKLKPTSVRAYIAYHLPGGGRRVYEVNSSTAYLAGNEFKERIVSERPDAVHVSGQNVSISFDSDAQVDLILDIARGELER
jgi:hypothetical protein